MRRHLRHVRAWLLGERARIIYRPNGAVWMIPARRLTQVLAP